jgi:hypothetical protein
MCVGDNETWWWINHGMGMYDHSRLWAPRQDQQKGESILVQGDFWRLVSLPPFVVMNWT